MRKVLIFALILGFSISAKADDLTTKMRSLFSESSKKETSAKELYTLTSKYAASSKAIYIGYKGVAELMMCNHVFSVTKKLGYFNSGKKWLELAIKQDPKNIELKFLRHCIQKNVPDFLGYNNNLTTDNAEITKYMNNPASDAKLVAFMRLNKQS